MHVLTRIYGPVQPDIWQNHAGKWKAACHGNYGKRRPDSMLLNQIEDIANVIMRTHLLYQATSASVNDSAISLSWLLIINCCMAGEKWEHETCENPRPQTHTTTRQAFLLSLISMTRSNAVDERYFPFRCCHTHALPDKWKVATLLWEEDEPCRVYHHEYSLLGKPQFHRS